jgi:type IV secretion system protein VirB1
MGGGGVSATVLTLATVLALAADPQCGAAAPGSEFQSRLAAIAIHESGGDPFVIGANADRARGLPATAIRSATPQEAATRAAALLAQGRSIDLGLMQINSGQLARHGLTLETAFDACRSMAAGADHYAADVRAVWNFALRRYNTGTVERGAAYAASVERVLARVPAIQIAGPYRAPATPEDTVVPEPPRPPPGMEDALHAGPPVPDDAAGLVDAFHRPSSVSPKEPAP